ncbi:MAG: NAD(P)-dependent dehydrogenase (short-subunit alcohol dehydrogenase family) [Planctomycetota bacterium]|jgi:NAD(P)-dependent dehydrogenase (short-subunit alcohol dehydrogenase family)
MTKTALLIGNSDGIGKALTSNLLNRGWKVIGASRSNLSVGFENYEHHVLDVCDASYPDQLAEVIEGREPALCIYCAGIGEGFDPNDLRSGERTFQTNLMGMVITLRVVLPSLRKQEGAVFAGLSSMADAVPNPGAPAYSASKSGMSFYLEGVAKPLRSIGVRVSNVRLGFVDTKMAKAAVKPFIISTDQAAERILTKLLAKSPAVRINLPWRSAALLRVIAILRGIWVFPSIR